MVMGNPVSPTETEPKAHVSLTDGPATLEFVCYSQSGERDHRAVKRFPLVDSAIKFVQGESQYSDDEFPTIAQDDWSGGRAWENFDKDKSRFFDSWRMNTQREGVVMGGREIYTTGGWRDQNNNLPGSGIVSSNHYDYGVAFTKLRTTYKYVAGDFTTGDGYTAGNIEVWLKYIGTPTGGVNIAIHNDNAGAVGSEVYKHFVDMSNLGYEANVSHLVWCNLETPQALSSSTKYWLVVYASQDEGDDNCYLVGRGGGGSFEYSANGSSWTSGFGPPYFRLSDDATGFVAHFFEYKGQLYFATQPDDGSAGKLFMNGFRGSCDVNANLGRLIDATAPQGGFSGFYDATAKIVAGDPSAKELTPWRTATIASSTQLVVEWDWVLEHDDMDEYVILGTDVWNEIGDTASTITSPISDVTVGNGIVFLAQAGGAALVQHREFNNFGTWQWDSDCWRNGGGHCHYVKLLNDLTKGATLWMGRNPGAMSGRYVSEYKSWVHYASLPDAWDGGKLFWTELDSGGDAWDEQVISEVTASYTDNNVKFALTADFTTGIVGSEVISSTNLVYGNHIELTVKSGEDMSAGDLQLLLSNLPNCVTPLFTLNFPYIKKNEAATVKLPFDSEGVAGVDAIVSIGLQITDEKDAAFSIEIVGATILYQDSSPVKIGQGAENITGVEIYDDPERFWIFTEGEIGYMQNDIYTPIPLREIRSLRSMYNGLASAVAGVYLYFSMGFGRVMRYFRQNIDSIGPDRDAGLPADRKGYISAMVAYPGDKLIIAVDGGRLCYSCIVMWSGNGWHELYRSPRINQPIRSLYVQSLDGSDTQRLWFSMRNDVLWLPITPNPAIDPDYRFAHEGHLITSWMYANKQALEKVYHNLSLFAENLEYTPPYSYIIEVDYQKDSDSTWTALPSAFSTSPVQTVDMTSTANATVSGRRIRFRYRFQTTSPKVSPRLMTSVLKAYAIQEIKFGYAFTTKLSEDDLSIDLEGDEIGSANYSTRVETAQAKMDLWAASMTKLTFNAVYSGFDDKDVYLKSIPVQPLTMLADDQIEEQFLQVVVHEFETS